MNERITSSAPSEPAPGAAQHPTAKEQVASSANRVVEKASSELSGLKNEIVEQGKDAADAVRDKAERIVDRGKRAGTAEIEGYVGAARRAADDLEENSPTGARYLREAAAGVEAFSSSLREKSVGEVIDVVQEFARRQPMTFFAGTLLAGLAIVRFAKSSSVRQTSPSDRSDASSALGDQATAHSSPGASSLAPKGTPLPKSNTRGEYRHDSTE